MIREKRVGHEALDIVLPKPGRWFPGMRFKVQVGRSADDEATDVMVEARYDRATKVWFYANVCASLVLLCGIGGYLFWLLHKMQTIQVSLDDYLAFPGPSEYELNLDIVLGGMLLSLLPLSAAAIVKISTDWRTIRMLRNLWSAVTLSERAPQIHSYSKEARVTVWTGLIAVGSMSLAAPFWLLRDGTSGAWLLTLSIELFLLLPVFSVMACSVALERLPPRYEVWAARVNASVLWGMAIAAPSFVLVLVLSRGDEAIGFMLSDGMSVAAGYGIIAIVGIVSTRTAQKLERSLGSADAVPSAGFESLDVDVRAVRRFRFAVQATYALLGVGSIVVFAGTIALFVTPAFQGAFLETAAREGATFLSFSATAIPAIWTAGVALFRGEVPLDDILFYWLSLSWRTSSFAETRSGRIFGGIAFALLYVPLAIAIWQLFAKPAWRDTEPLRGGELDGLTRPGLSREIAEELQVRRVVISWWADPRIALFGAAVYKRPKESRVIVILDAAALYRPWPPKELEAVLWHEVHHVLSPAPRLSVLRQLLFNVWSLHAASISEDSLAREAAADAYSRQKMADRGDSTAMIRAVERLAGASSGPARASDLRTLLQIATGNPLIWRPHPHWAMRRRLLNE